MIAPVILRAALGLALIHEAYTERKTRRSIALIKTLAGICLLIGFLTQLGALISVIIIAYALWRRDHPVANDYLLLQLAIAIALLFLGPGVFSLDFPL